MEIYTINRLWNNLASVRDYIVQKCVQEKKGLRIQLRNSPDYMTIPADELEERMFQAHKTTMKSKFGAKTYQLIDFVWITGKKE